MTRKPILPPADNGIPPLSVPRLTFHLVCLLITTMMSIAFFLYAWPEVVSLANSINKIYNMSEIAFGIKIGCTIVAAGTPLGYVAWISCKLLHRDPVPPSDYDRWVEQGKESR